MGPYNELLAMRPTESDFEDELLNGFDRHERYLIYFGMADWSGQQLSERFVTRRLAVEKEGLARRILEGELAKRTYGSGQIKRKEEPPSYEERTPDFKRKLGDLVFRHVSNPNDWAAFQRIISLNSLLKNPHKV
jgi:hypothetical protein